MLSVLGLICLWLCPVWALSCFQPIRLGLFPVGTLSSFFNSDCWGSFCWDSFLFCISDCWDSFLFYISDCWDSFCWDSFLLGHFPVFQLWLLGLILLGLFPVGTPSCFASQTAGTHSVGSLSAGTLSCFASQTAGTLSVGTLSRFLFWQIPVGTLSILTLSSPPNICSIVVFCSEFLK